MKTPRKFEAELAAVQAGEVSFDHFARATANTWRGLAGYLMRRWRTPDAVQAEDVVQELLVAAHALLPKWDRTRAPLARFVVWNACNRAKEWMHRQRGVRYKDDRARARFLPTVTRLARADREAASRLADRLWCPPPQEAQVERAEEAERLLDLCRNVRERTVLWALLEADGRVDLAADRLYLDVEARWLCRLGSEAEARRRVRKLLRALAERARAAA